MILQKTRSTSHPCWIRSPSRTFTSGKADHTVTGTSSSATSSSEKRWLNWVALKKSSLRWIGLQAKTTVILPPKQKLTSTVATDGFARTWWISIRCQQGINLTSRKHCRHCTASRKRRTTRTMKSGHTVPPHGGSGKQTGGNPIMRIHHKDGVTTDWTVKPVYSVGNYSFAVWISATIECTIYREYIGYSWQQSTVTDGRCKYNTIPPETEIHEQMTMTNGYVKVCTTTSTLSTTGETIVDNYVNDATHVDMCKMQTWAHLHAVCSCIAWFIHITFHMAQAARTAFHSHPIHGHVQRSLSVFLFITLYLLLLLFFVPFLMTDGDSVTIDNLRDSANVTFVTLDDSLPHTSSWRSICSYPGKNGGCSPIIENFTKSKCPNTWIRLPRHWWPKSWSSMKTKSFLLSKICVVILWQD